MSARLRPRRTGDPYRSPESPTRPRARTDRSRRIRLAIGAILGLGGLFALLYAVALHTYVPNSDAATVALEGQAIAHGHILLSGWAISLDSFWTIDALWYLVAILLFGVHLALLQIVPALIATAVIAVGIVMAVEERRGMAVVVAGGTVIAILALPSQALSDFFLNGPLHVGTTLWALVAFLAVRRGRFGRGFALAVVLLAAGLLGDLQMLALGVAPVFLAGLTAIGRRRDWRSGFAQLTAAASAVVLAEVIRRVASAIGTFSIAKANPIATHSQMISNLRLGVHEGVALMGVGGAYYGLGAVPRALTYVHLLAVVIVAAAVAGAGITTAWGTIAGRPSVVGSSSESAWRLDDMLLFGALGSCVAFVVLAASSDPGYGRYLTAGIIFGAILAGRLLGRLSQTLRWGAAGRVAASVGLAATCCYAAGVAINLDRAEPISSTAELAGWLDAHHLHNGIGVYWAASIVTVESRGSVRVRPVVSPDGLRIVRYNRNSSASWYNKPFQFLVLDLGTPWANVSWQTAVNTFGTPSRSYVVAGAYRVVLWNRPIHVSPAIPAG